MNIKAAFVLLERAATAERYEGGRGRSPLWKAANAGPAVQRTGRARQKLVSLHTWHLSAENPAATAARPPTQNVYPPPPPWEGASLRPAAEGAPATKMSAPRPRAQPASYPAPRRPLVTAATLRSAPLRCGGCRAEDRMRKSRSAPHLAPLPVGR